MGIVHDYLNFIDEHVVRLIEEGGVSRSCFASYLLISAAIDALGGLAHESPEASPRERFSAFIEKYMPDEYRERTEELWALRNALAHQALNVAAVLTAAEAEGGFSHLEGVPISPFQGVLYVDTSRFLKDFKIAKDRMRADLGARADLMARAENRLVRMELRLPEDLTQTIPPTFYDRGRTLKFVRLKCEDHRE